MADEVSQNGTSGLSDEEVPEIELIIRVSTNLSAKRRGVTWNTYPTPRIVHAKESIRVFVDKEKSRNWSVRF